MRKVHFGFLDADLQPGLALSGGGRIWRGDHGLLGSVARSLDLKRPRQDPAEVACGRRMSCPRLCLRGGGALLRQIHGRVHTCAYGSRIPGIAGTTMRDMKSGDIRNYLSAFSASFALPCETPALFPAGVRKPACSSVIRNPGARMRNTQPLFAQPLPVRVAVLSGAGCKGDCLCQRIFSPRSRRVFHRS